ncbi:hypothetical protein THASP1DRAFT_29049 [Thamnocephalis sphaerospora]|uniref:Uncharacterized protein n=1 Tax=Thamnocephalis sphaerospora TaxID=78915 RepID=A0A4V1IWY2_9FUNG|nr:hypothetical protein THASP1DRAFT_29049 [Thamnocephalis sphaerospora]|eukprot:RKP09149.1 hypothetical protein THASP1DRAFT_29049 [Thamnocephalis sphaerospora]
MTARSRSDAEHSTAAGRAKAKVIEVSASTVLDLKAELFRATERFEREKRAATVSGHIPARKVLKVAKNGGDAKKNRGVAERNARDVDRHAEDAVDLVKSRQALERKARIYEQLRRGEQVKGMGDRSAEELLIDFDQKRWDEEDYGKPDDEADPALGTLFIDTHGRSPGDNEDDPLVEYTDEFGRARMMRRSEIPRRPASPYEDDGRPTMMSADMYREQERLRWEAEAEAEANAGPLHYDANKEVRTKGVGFYQFAADEDERAAQQRDLNKLRDETTQKRAAHQNAREKRRAQLAARAEELRRKRARRQGQLEPDEEAPVDRSTATAISGLISSVRASVNTPADAP